jgi:hypothetical protein
VRAYNVPAHVTHTSEIDRINVLLKVAMHLRRSHCPYNVIIKPHVQHCHLDRWARLVSLVSEIHC